MKALEYSTHLDLPDERVAVCGDWHGNVHWVRTLARALSTLAPEITTILQLGDWWMNPRDQDAAFKDSSIDTVLVTLGNHEPWNLVTPLLDTHPGSSVRVSAMTWLLSRPAYLTIGGRRVLSLGGASSVDKAWRKPGASWWPDEDITDAQAKAALVGAANYEPADLMLTHETPDLTPVKAVRAVLRENPLAFPDDALAGSANSRHRVGKVWAINHPELLIHGHMHVPGGGQTDDGRRVASMGRDGQQGSLGFLDMRTLRMETPSLRQIREAAEA
ncbi:metallophosphoesterase [Microbacterium sp. C5A9]|uniref:metallophosphoesterase family protein n=1 Tax=Microbacterium sp. C5A9 TaxID=2736663 RepID=UPI001F515B11|nr:metallophosphoesterase [Microbacterium sp. C5A9]MCI1017350.1 metallophosphoesterase [Microbacterium sp. C5A9]